jgi:hypothetical protein
MTYTQLQLFNVKLNLPIIRFLSFVWRCPKPAADYRAILRNFTHVEQKIMNCEKLWIGCKRLFMCVCVGVLLSDVLLLYHFVCLVCPHSNQ